ncbi:MAG: bppU [Bacteriophage sp.]|nr:MAG: bppU [Bacteriophage sp.]
MANDQLVLQINKINISPDKSYVKYNQNERGKVIDINVIDNDGINAYDLTNKKIRFVDDKEDNKLVLDDEADNPGHFTRTADAQGKFSYIFHDLVYQRSGIARFEIYTDSEHIDATANFEIQIENTGSLAAANESYISSLEGLVAHYHSTVDTTVSETQQLINSLTDKINRAISNGQRDVANQLTDMRNQLQAIQNRENGLIQNWTADFNTRKADFDKLKSDWQEQSKSISDDYASKKAKIESDAQSQHNSIQAAADQQLKNNQSANDAELAKVESETKAKLDEVEKAKNDAIADLTAQRDAAISQAKVDFQAKIDAFQKDYDAWKSATLADFTKQLADINTNISNDQSTLKDFDKQLDYTKQELAAMVKQLDSLDFTKFVTGDTFKTAMAKKASGLKVMGLGGEYVMAVDQSDQNINGLPNGVQGLADIGVLSGALQVLADAILDKNHYTKLEVDKMVNDAKNAIMGVVDTKANASDLNNKADKSQIQSLSSQLESYKQENDNLKNENSQLTNRVQTLENKQFIAHVASEDQVASQTAPIVIVDD